eukprot:1426689-Rhodomonas_salina.1
MLLYQVLAGDGLEVTCPLNNRRVFPVPYFVCATPTPLDPFVLPDTAASLPYWQLPRAPVLSAALAEDNFGAGLYAKGAHDAAYKRAYGAWERRVRGERKACGEEAWEERKEAFEWDESLRCGAQ